MPTDADSTVPDPPNRIDARAARPRVARFQLKRTRCDWHARAQAELRDGVVARVRQDGRDNQALHCYEEIVTALASWIAVLARRAREPGPAGDEAAKLLEVLASQGRVAVRPERLTPDAVFDLGAGVAAAIRAHAAAGEST